MLSITLVLLVATSALAIPIANVEFVPIEYYSYVADNGQGVSAAAIQRAYAAVYDESDENFYLSSGTQAFHVLADLNDGASQAAIAAQGIAMLAQLANGIPGDSCVSAALINAVLGGNQGAIRESLRRYIDLVINNGIDDIVALSQNPSAARYSAGRPIGCPGGGRDYDFDGAWELILNNANSVNAGALSEVSCVLKRLYQGFSIRSNNIAASATAGSLPPVIAVFQSAMGPAANFVRSIGTPNIAFAAANAKAALAQAAYAY